MPQIGDKVTVQYSPEEQRSAVVVALHRTGYIIRECNRPVAGYVAAEAVVAIIH
jgi:hypothetical protein